MVVGIVLIVLGAAGGLAEFIAERHRRRFRLILAIATTLFGVANLISHERGSNVVIDRLDRYGTVTNWQASSPTLRVEGGNSRKAGHYALVVKIIPQNHERVRRLNLHVDDAVSANEPSRLDDASARWLFWVMADETGTVDIRKEYESGIYTSYYSGEFDPADELVKFHTESQTYWPSLYPSLKDLEGKYVVARILATGLDRPIFSELRLTFESPAGQQLVILLPKTFEPRPGAPYGKVLITTPERYIGGLIRNGRFLPRAADE